MFQNLKNLFRSRGSYGGEAIRLPSRDPSDPLSRRLVAIANEGSPDRKRKALMMLRGERIDARHLRLVEEIAQTGNNQCRGEILLLISNSSEPLMFAHVIADFIKNQNAPLAIKTIKTACRLELRCQEIEEALCETIFCTKPDLAGESLQALLKLGSNKKGMLSVVEKLMTEEHQRTRLRSDQSFPALVKACGDEARHLVSLFASLLAKDQPDKPGRDFFKELFNASKILRLLGENSKLQIDALLNVAGWFCGEDDLVGTYDFETGKRLSYTDACLLEMTRLGGLTPEVSSAMLGYMREEIYIGKTELLINFFKACGPNYGGGLKGLVELSQRWINIPAEKYQDRVIRQQGAEIAEELFAESPGLETAAVCYAGEIATLPESVKDFNTYSNSSVGSQNPHWEEYRRPYLCKSFLYLVNHGAALDLKPLPVSGAKRAGELCARYLTKNPKPCPEEKIFSLLSGLKAYTPQVTLFLLNFFAFAETAHGKIAALLAEEAAREKDEKVCSLFLDSLSTVSARCSPEALKEAVPGLIGVLERRNVEVHVLEKACSVLTLLGEEGREAIPALTLLLFSDNKDFKLIAKKALNHVAPGQ